MSDHYSTKIIVGGSLARALLAEFVDAIREWAPDYGESPGWEASDVEYWVDRGESLRLYDDAAYVGQEDAVLWFAREHGLSYIFSQNGEGMFDNERRIFGRDPGAGEEHDSVDDADHANMDAGQLKERASWGLTLQDVIAQMEQRDNFAVPPLVLVD